MHVLMISTETDALPGAKVGGMADVVGQASLALADIGCRVTVLMPSHGFLHRLPGAARQAAIEFGFRGYPHEAALFEVPGHPKHDRMRYLVVHHPRLDAPDPVTDTHRIYVHDPPDRPFAGDASRFALFCAAAATAIPHLTSPPADLLHLHDWHTAFLLMLRKFDPRHAALKNIRTVFSIHNLALQGIRPLRGDDSSLEAWYPGLSYDWFDVSDPHRPDCVNLMAAGIRLADMVHTVSPTYAREIRQPSREPEYYGGEGLEAALQYAHGQGHMIGILNGCAYPDGYRPQKMRWGQSLEQFSAALIQWAGSTVRLPTAHFIAHARLLELQRQKSAPEIILTSVGRLVPQKMQLLRATDSDGASALERLLVQMDSSGCLIVLGSGDEGYVNYLARLSSRHQNFLFLNGYSESCARTLYANGDLFLMPSSFEPCGISQMLAMRDGQPCVAHAVGGLKDTVRHGVDGFLFEGRTLDEQADQFVQTALAAMRLKQADPGQWRQICANAAAARFSWSHTARQYIEKLY